MLNLPFKIVGLMTFDARKIDLRLTCLDENTKTLLS